jgi:hypothetical protein
MVITNSGENRMMRRVLGLKREVGKGKSGKIRSEELHTSYAAPTT